MLPMTDPAKVRQLNMLSYYRSADIANETVQIARELKFHLLYGGRQTGS